MIVKQLEEQDKSSWPDIFFLVMWANRRATSIFTKGRKNANLS